MKTIRRIVTPERAANVRKSFECFPEWIYIKGFGANRVPRGKYKYRVIFQSRRGGNEWTPSHLITQFEVYY